MAKLIINEKTYIEELLSSYKKPEDLSISQLVHLLAKWFYEKEKWYNNEYKEVKEPLILRTSKNGKKYIDTKVMNECVDILYFSIDDTLNRFKIKDYSSISYEKMIKDSCRLVLRYKLKLKDSDKIALLSDELENIKSCKTDRQKKLLFVCYIFARYKNANGKLDERAVKKQIFDLANIGGSKLDKQKLIKELKDLGFVKQNMINDNINVWVNLGEGAPIIEITDFKNLGNYILAYLKPNYKQCECCGKLVKIKSKNDGSTKYCDKCAEKFEKEKTKIRVKNFRERL